MKLPLPFTKGKFLHVTFSTAAIAAAAQAGLAELVIAAQKTDLGKTVAQAVAAAEATGKSGTEKLADVLAIVTPKVIEYAATGGVTAAIGDAETFARYLIEDEVARLKRTGLVAIITAVLSVFKVSMA